MTPVKLFSMPDFRHVLLQIHTFEFPSLAPQAKVNGPKVKRGNLAERRILWVNITKTCSVWHNDCSAIQQINNYTNKWMYGWINWWMNEWMNLSKEELRINSSMQHLMKMKKTWCEVLVYNFWILKIRLCSRVILQKKLKKDSIWIWKYEFLLG